MHDRLVFHSTSKPSIKTSSKLLRVSQIIFSMILWQFEVEDWAGLSTKRRRENKIKGKQDAPMI